MEPIPGFDIIEKVCGPDDTFLGYIASEISGTTIAYRGRGAGSATKLHQESPDALHLYIENTSPQGLSQAVGLAAKLVDQAREDYEQFKATQAPPPQQYGSHYGAHHPPPTQPGYGHPPPAQYPPQGYNNYPPQQSFPPPQQYGGHYGAHQPAPPQQNYGYPPPIHGGYGAPAGQFGAPPPQPPQAGYSTPRPPPPIPPPQGGGAVEDMQRNPYAAAPTQVAPTVPPPPERRRFMEKVCTVLIPVVVSYACCPTALGSGTATAWVPVGWWKLPVCNISCLKRNLKAL
jgi:hypothetical protein